MLDVCVTCARECDYRDVADYCDGFGYVPAGCCRYCGAAVEYCTCG